MSMLLFYAAVECIHNALYEPYIHFFKPQLFGGNNGNQNYEM